MANAERKGLNSYNMLVTFNPKHSEMSRTELGEALSKIGEEQKFKQSKIEGVFTAKVSDSRKVVARLREMCIADPNMFAFTHHYVPIDAWCKSDIREMQKLIKKAAVGILENDEWKISVRRRHWNKLEGTKLVLKLAQAIERGRISL